MSCANNRYVIIQLHLVYLHNNAVVVGRGPGGGATSESTSLSRLHHHPSRPAATLSPSLPLSLSSHPLRALLPARPSALPAAPRPDRCHSLAAALVPKPKGKVTNSRISPFLLGGLVRRGT